MSTRPADFTIKTNDDTPAFLVEVQTSYGEVVDLTGATNVEFHMRNELDKTVKIDTGTGATVYQADPGILRYTWQAGDLNTPGRYEAEFAFQFSGGEDATVPSDGYWIIEVVEEIS